MRFEARIRGQGTVRVLTAISDTVEDAKATFEWGLGEHEQLLWIRQISD